MDKTAAIRSQARRAVLTKAAEALGVSSGALYKQALPAWVGRGVDAAVGGAKRLGQLLAGGNKAELGALQNFKGKPLKARLGNWWRTMTGANARNIEAKLREPGLSADAVYGLGNELSRRQRATSELRKVFGARLGVGASGAAGLYGAGKGLLGGSNAADDGQQ